VPLETIKRGGMWFRHHVSIRRKSAASGDSCRGGDPHVSII